MRRVPRRLTVLGVVATAVALGGSAAASPATTAARPQSGAAAASRQGAGAAPLLLINGDRLLVRTAPGGGQQVGLLAAPDRTGLVAVRPLGAEIPLDALPYLGRGLDPSLFQLSALQRAESGGRLPVQVSFAGRKPALPGVTITRTGRGREYGYLTASSARVFGAALARQFRADHARASYGADGLFANGTGIALAGAPAAKPAIPAFPMHTLTVAGTNLAGRPDTGDLVSVFNVDNLAAFPSSPFGSDNFFYHGTAKFSVPSGRYWAIGQFFAPDGSVRLDVLPQFTVNGSTTVRVSERAASSQITITTPRPAVTLDTSLTIIRATPGAVVSFGFDVGGGALWVNPTTQPPTDGTLQTFSGGTLISPPGPGTPYAYNLDFPGPAGVIPAQNYVVQPGDLATVNEQYYQDVTSTGGWLSYGGTLYQIENSLVGGFFLPLRLPGRQVHYLSATPPMLWQSRYFEYLPPSQGQTPGGQTSAWRLVTGGQQLTHRWNRYPLHPAPNVSLPGTDQLPNLPSAVRSGNMLILDITPFSDNQPGDTGTGFSCLFSACGSTITGSYALYQNGVKIAGGNAAASGSSDFFAQAALSPHPAKIRLVLTASRASQQFWLSPSSQDVWTWHSRREPNATVPPPWFCGFTSSGLDRHCVVQPMLTLGYQVQGLALNGTTTAGHQVIELSVGHLQAATAAPVTGASAQVSYNDGMTWQPATAASEGGGNFRITFTAPAGVDVTLRVSGTDAAGGSITETILRAYGVR